MSPLISVSRQNERFELFQEFGPVLFPVDTFSTGTGALARMWRIPLLRSRLARHIRQHRIQAVITLMPHIWTPLVAPAVRRAGARYVTIIHDADPHPGDVTGLVHGWGLRDALHADLILTLSQAVAGRLAATGLVPRRRLLTLFHPDFTLGPLSRMSPPAPGEPFRLLFLGRILPYKGLGLLLDAVELLREDGVPVHLGVFGSGSLCGFEKRLAAIGAEVANRWLSEEEIAAVLRRYHAVALSHVEASQTGVAAAAFGMGLPAVATPVGGLIEQVENGRSGVLADRADAWAFAEAIRRLADNPALYRAIRRHLEQSAESRSMARFVKDVVAHAVHATA